MARSPAHLPPRRCAATPDEFFITGKITAPALPGWILPRPRIHKRIAAGARGPLTVITGPPGAGKTMAMASWAAASARVTPAAWVTLDEYDNRPRVFWAYVVEALRRAGVPVTRQVSTAARGGAADLAFVVRLASAIAAHGPVSLCLDDLHLVTAHSHLAGLARLLRNASPSLHLVVASRGDPGFPLHRYRLAGELTEIRADELAFTLSEARQLMAQHGVSLPPDAVEFLTERAEGWAAALRLAAISIDGSPDPELAVKEITTGDGAVAGYLVEEVLNTLPPRVRNLLLKTSILDRVSAGIAQELAQDEHATTELPALAEANAFVEPLHHGWYRYHALFAEMLRLKLRREVPDEVPGLRRRAAHWLRRNGTLAEAARQAAEAGDWQLAARIAVDELAVGQLAEPGTIDPLAEVLRGLPRGVAWTQPQPWLVTAALGLSGDPQMAAGPALASAQRMLQQLPGRDEIPSRLAAALVTLAMARRGGDLEAARHASDDAVGLLRGVPADVARRRPEASAQVMAAHGAVAFWAGDAGQAAAAFRTAADAPGTGRLRAECLGHLALAEAVQGRLASAGTLAAEAAGAREDGSVAAGPPNRAVAAAHAYIHLHRLELAQARRWLNRADRALRTSPDKLVGGVAGLVAAYGCLAEGRPREARQIVARTRHGWSPGPWLERGLALVESRACLATGDVTAALDTAARARPSLEAAAATAQAWLAAGDAHEAKLALAQAAALFEGAPDQAKVAARLAEARLAQACGERGHALRSLGEAIKLAEAERLRLPFALERDWIRRAAERDPGVARAYSDLLEPGRAEPGHATALPAGTADAGPAAPPATATAGKPVVVEKLSDREREVLRHVSEMLATTEIATEMYISVNTVKSHLKSIFRKLGVAGRNEAVRRARKLELI
jgi:LuxR family transcriptional regulator, maltose regulon positive regulatory protein